MERFLGTAGFVTYAILFTVTAVGANPSSHAPAVVGLLFVHSLLMAAMFKSGEFCWLCAVIAVVGLMVASLQVTIKPSRIAPFCAAIVAGICCYPLGVVENARALLRTDTDATAMSMIPKSLDREILHRCEHRLPVRVVLVDNRSCKTCKKMTRLREELLSLQDKGEWCIHYSDLTGAVDVDKPFVVLVKGSQAAVMIEGVPSLAQVVDHLRGKGELATSHPTH